MANKHRQFGLFEMFAWTAAWGMLFAADKFLLERLSNLGLLFALLLTIMFVVTFFTRIGMAFGGNPIRISALLYLVAAITSAAVGAWRIWINQESINDFFPIIFGMMNGTSPEAEFLIAGLMLMNAVILGASSLPDRTPPIHKCE